jgi:hypothetical protein
MLDDPVIPNEWYDVAYALDLKEGKPMIVSLLEEGL